MPGESNGGQGGALGQVQLQEEQGSPKEQQQDAVLDQEGQATLPGQGRGEKDPNTITDLPAEFGVKQVALHR